MTVSEEMVLAGAKALHEAWRLAVMIDGQDGAWDGLHKNDKATYLKDSRTALTAALSDQVVVPKEPTTEMFEAAMLAYSDDNGEKLYPDFFAKLYRAMIAAASPPTKPDPR